MKFLNKTACYAVALLAAGIGFAGCQKMEQPAVGEYPVDTNPPGGPLKFYAAFDGTTSSPAMNAVDSVRANFPADNPLKSIPGVSGQAVQGETKKFIKYSSFNDWARSSSFTISTWIKKDGKTTNNEGGNGPEYIFSLRGNDDKYHWSSSVMLVFLEGDNAGCGVKVMCVSPSDPANGNSSSTDNWFTWENAGAIPGILDNNWHHLAMVYDETTSEMKLYVDGVENPNVKTWANHGALRLANQKIGEYRIGRGPRNDGEADGAGGWLQSSLKGSLDQFRLYSSVLSAADIAALYTQKR